MSPVFAMNVSAPMSTGATQADTMSADSAPITPTPMNVPARCWLLASLRRDWMKLGISMVNAPNIELASTTNSSANGMRTSGWLKMACRLRPLPMYAASTPMVT